TGLKVGRIFKKVKNVSVINAGGTKGSFIRLLAVVDLSKALPRCTSIKFQDKQVLVGFQYERLVNLCYYCGKIGHLDRSCKHRLEDIDKGKLKGGQYGDWMKALDVSQNYMWYSGRFGQHHSSGGNSSEHNLNSASERRDDVSPQTNEANTETSLQLVVIDHGNGGIETTNGGAHEIINKNMDEDHIGTKGGPGWMEGPLRIEENQEDTGKTNVMAATQAMDLSMYNLVETEVKIDGSGSSSLIPPKGGRSWRRISKAGDK
ncbi:Unknown protein, partial [Striga hermonthica]